MEKVIRPLLHIACKFAFENISGLTFFRLNNLNTVLHLHLEYLHQFHNLRTLKSKLMMCILKFSIAFLHLFMFNLKDNWQYVLKFRFPFNFLEKNAFRDPNEMVSKSSDTEILGVCNNIHCASLAAYSIRYYTWNDRKHRLLLDISIDVITLNNLKMVLFQFLSKRFSIEYRPNLVPSKMAENAFFANKFASKSQERYQFQFHKNILATREGMSVRIENWTHKQNRCCRFN